LDNNINKNNLGAKNAPTAKPTINVQKNTPSYNLQILAPKKAANNQVIYVRYLISSSGNGQQTSFETNIASKN
jgi:hypothetical protein